MIWETLVNNRDQHLSAAEIADAVRAHASKLHQATIYRTLDALVEDGLVLRTDLGAHRKYYELATEHRHHHVVCSGCGAVAHIHDKELETIAERVQTASGYTLDDVELTLSGRCPKCAAS